MTRDEHVAWCKERAREYLHRGDPGNAFASMVSDMGKHKECKVPPELAMVGMIAVRDGDLRGVERFIEGFN